MSNLTNKFDSHREDIIAEVRKKVLIIDYFNRYLDADRCDRLYNTRGCLCPLHSENAPSFRWYPNTNSWYCFGQCSKGGDVIAFHKAYVNMMISNNIEFPFKKQVPRIKMNYGSSLLSLIDLFNIDISKFTEKRNINGADVVNTINDLVNRFELKAPKDSIKIDLTFMYNEIETKLRSLKDADFDMYIRCAMLYDFLNSTIVKDNSLYDKYKSLYELLNSF